MIFAQHSFVIMPKNILSAFNNMFIQFKASASVAVHLFEQSTIIIPNPRTHTQTNFGAADSQCPALLCSPFRQTKRMLLLRS